ncbi:MAG: glycosyltransferase family 1 protein [Verrucomicrobiales bacterium]|nr:glycosyltransferase family 1 protein [Verrucomicrobiales bacterium]
MSRPLTLNARFRHRPVTGVERFAIEVVKRLPARTGAEVAEIEPSAPLAGLRGHAWEQWVLPRKIETGSTLFSPCNTGPLTVRNQLVVIHDAAVWDHPEAFSCQFGTLYRQLLPALAKRVAAVGTVSEFSRGRLSRYLGISEERIHVLGNAASSSFQPPVQPKAVATPTILCVGSLDPRKNFNRLVDAWIQLSDSGKLPEDARLKIIGSAKPTNFSGFEAKDFPGISWLGRVSDEALIEHYQSATAFVFPSFYEGFGLPPLEAMACGCPVLLSHAASLPEVGGIEFNGRTGDDSEGAVFYFDPLSINDIADSLVRVLEMAPSLVLQMSRNAIAHASGFSWDSVADRTRAALPDS